MAAIVPAPSMDRSTSSAAPLSADGFAGVKGCRIDRPWTAQPPGQPARRVLWPCRTWACGVCFRPYTHFLGRRVVTAEGCSACSRRVWRGHFPRVACRRGQGLGAAFVRPDARRRHEACLPRPVDATLSSGERTVARRFLRCQAGISGCSACVFPALACGRLVDLSSAN